MNRLQRREGEGEREAGSVGPVELFFDLVFVFAVTQVSHLLLADLSWEGAGEAALALLVIWWAWNYTTWVTNELDTESNPVRLMLIGLMLACLLMAVAIPQAFGDRALLFAGSYAVIQVGRHSFLTFAACDRGTMERHRAVHVLVWLTAASALWVAGALADGELRTILWLCALAIDYSGPFFLYRVPGMKPVGPEAWQVTTEHFAERFQLFVIIALGETIVVTGATTSDLDLDLGILVAFAVAFLMTAAMWWLYFNLAARMAARRLALADDSTTLARDAYTYMHVLLVAGIIVAAVGDEIVIAHPADELGAAELIAVVAGPVIYLLTMSLLRWRMARSIATKRLVAAGACVAVGLAGISWPALVVSSALLAVLVILIAVELRATNQRRARGEPEPAEALG